MTGASHVAGIWRHPIKSLGSERVTRAELSPGRTMPNDRVWALAHEKSRYDREAAAWAPPNTWMRCTVVPSFAAVTARVNEATGRLTLSHPDRSPITFHPEAPTDRDRFIAWVEPLMPGSMPRPTGLVRVPGRGMTDTDFPSISVASLASLRVLSQRMGTTLDPRRFRANIWLEGLAPWQEFDLVGHELTVGAVHLRIVERIGRCNATKANPATGRRDAETLDALEARFGHTDFGVYAEVVTGGIVAEGDPAGLRVTNR